MAQLISNLAPPLQFPYRAIGGSLTKATCPVFTRSVVRRASFVRVSDVQRLQVLSRSLGTVQDTQTYKLAASLTYAGQKRLDSGDVSTNVWSGEVGGQAAPGSAPCLCGGS